ncbi:hypothetical protein VTN00DRAFT_1319 [Thermoascus crustaceus]|uniref:uncharacterized protein n=1 Tax=Thermoascus crustaceus TaxID=5088 RepID=UPI003741EE98
MSLSKDRTITTCETNLLNRRPCSIFDNPNGTNQNFRLACSKTPVRRGKCTNFQIVRYGFGPKSRGEKRIGVMSFFPVCQLSPRRSCQIGNRPCLCSFEYQEPICNASAVRSCNMPR